MMCKKIAVFLALISVFALSSCLSEQERKERRQDAFDLSGKYSARIESGSELQADLEIHNIEGRHRISIDLVRTSDLTKQETGLLAAASLDAQLVRDTFLNKPLKFATRSNRVEIGGGNSTENNSDDNGLTSTFSLCSEEVLSGLKPAGFDRGHIDYCLNGVARKGTEIVIQGELVMEIVLEKDEPKADGTTRVTYDSRSAAVPYKTQGKAMHLQYGGRWIGEVHTQPNQYLDNIAGLEFVIADGKYHSFPLFREMTMEGTRYSRRDVIELNGLPFTFEKVEESVEKLDNTPYPVIRAIYRHKESGQRLVFVGGIWSLSEFSGTILLIDPENETELGAFKLGRQ